MSFPQDQIEELKETFPGAASVVEAGVTFFFLPAVALPDGCTPAVCNLLLCPTPRDGYPARLFFSERIDKTPPPPQPLNWNGNIRIMEQNWCAYSWNQFSGDHRLAQLVLILMRPLR